MGVVELEAEGASEMMEELGREPEYWVDDENENLLSHEGVWWEANVGEMGGEASGPSWGGGGRFRPWGIVSASLFFRKVLA
jgi:hypothetical protein